MQQTETMLPASEHFELKRLADGVYAAFGIVGSMAFSNAGIIDLGDQTLIFDTFETPMAAQDLRSAAEQLTGRPATHVINSHAHADHWCGNQAFGPLVAIIATHGIRAGMPAAVDWLKELKEDPAGLETEIREQQELLEAETDPHRRASLESYIARMSGWLAMLPTLEFRLPNQTFDGKLVFYGTQRTAELHSVAPGHTASDAYLLLPADRIMFMGDLGFFQSQPFMVYCEPQAWKAWLEEAEQADVELFVPGHGPLGTKDDLVLQRQYITVLEELVALAIQEGLPAEKVLEEVLPAPFDTWQHSSAARWEANVWSTYERLSGGPAG